MGSRHHVSNNKLSRQVTSHINGHNGMTILVAYPRVKQGSFSICRFHSEKLIPRHALINHGWTPVAKKFLHPNMSITSASNTVNFVTVNNPADPTFNQLLGINNANEIAGYFGSGADAAHPNKGYVLMAPNYLAQSSIMDGNAPNSVQTQDICINTIYVGGFFIDAKDITSGFIRNGVTGTFTTIQHPATGNGTVNQILGVNDGNYAVGFYTDGTGTNHGYSYAIKTQQFSNIAPPASFGCMSTTATGTNNKGDVVGFCTTTTNTTVSFWANNGQYTRLTAPGSTNTQALGINAAQQAVGSYVDAAGAMHGFVASSPQTGGVFMSVDHPAGVNGTVVNGINDAGMMVGFYVDAAGNTNGMLAMPGGSGMTSVAPGSGMVGGAATGTMVAMAVSSVKMSTMMTNNAGAAAPTTTAAVVKGPTSVSSGSGAVATVGLALVAGVALFL
ncbi:hypothetical protein BC830DRAFT_1155864 [Chytriomyces sp. MP71]|nr:hypothetical protein BC830DRAFT_1155864 [Chytriomyces sp. MP71]